MKSRLVCALVVVMAWVGAIGWRLYDVQVARHQQYLARALRQQQRVVDLDPPRGAIYDARGRQLAVSVEVESAFAVPREIPDHARAAAALAKVLGADARKLARQLDSDREFVWVGRKLDVPVAQAVRALALPGIYFLPESKRYYPLRELAAQVLGYVGTDNRGLGGLEAAYDRVVAGETVRRTVLKDARRGTLATPGLSFAEARPGDDLHLTLDAALQNTLERELAAAVERGRALSGSAVVLDPRTGAVLAMASYPTFDPNHFGEVAQSRWRNRPLQDAYEPGSTFKMVTAAAALEAGVIATSDVLDCEMGGITLANVRINDHKAFGLLTLREVMARSSNVGAVKVGLRAGEQRLYQTLRDFGFGAATGIDLPGESVGIVRPVENWGALTKAYVSFGQGLSVTALQLANAFGAVANGGTLYKPYVVASIGRGNGPRSYRAEPTSLGTPASPATMRALSGMLEAVVSEGTGGRAAVVGYPAAGKTGTAQKAIPGGYSPNGFIASFAGYAPAAQPALVAAIVIDEPRGAYHGGDVAAPVFGAFAREALLYLGAEPQREPLELWPGESAPEPIAPMPQLAQATESASEVVHARLEVPGGGAGEGVSAVALAALGEPAAAVGPVVPDLRGLTARAALVRASSLGLRPLLNGRGFIVRQEPAAGAPMRASRTIDLWLGPNAPALPASR